MNKKNMLLILGLALMVLVSGCATQADSGQYDYVPLAGQGCAFSADTCDEPSFVFESTNLNQDTQNKVVA